jgi:prolyl-tRNA synthetase
METEIGDGKYFMAENSDYAAHEDIALFEKEIKNKSDELLPLKEAAAERGPKMEDGVKLHNLPLWQQIKDVVFIDDQGRFILAIIRGDLDVNEVKLKNILKATDLRSATEDEIREKLKSEPGFISPVKIKDGLSADVKLIIVADDSLRTIANAYGGSNKKNLDLFNVNIDRDYQADIEGDIALAVAGFTALNGAGKLVEKKGIEVGNIFQLGYHYSEKMKGAVYIDAEGLEKPFYMGCYGIGVGRTMAAIIEAHNDERGMIWPEAVAPFSIHLIALDGAQAEGDKLYEQLLSKGVEVLYDDRDKAAGEKFADADLIGIPTRVVVSKKTLAVNSVEVKNRGAAEAKLIPLADFIK